MVGWHSGCAASLFYATVLRYGGGGGIQAMMQAYFVSLYWGMVVGWYSCRAASLFCASVLG